MRKAGEQSTRAGCNGTEGPRDGGWSHSGFFISNRPSFRISLPLYTYERRDMCGDTSSVAFVVVARLELRPYPIPHSWTSCIETNSTISKSPPFLFSFNYSFCFGLPFCPSLSLMLFRTPIFFSFFSSLAHHFLAATLSL